MSQDYLPSVSIVKVENGDTSSSDGNPGWTRRLALPNKAWGPGDGYGGGHLSPVKLALLTIAIFLSTFMASLDRLIVSTATPQITNGFGSLQDVGWYGSASLLTTCCTQLIFGRLYTLFPVRVILVCAILFFGAGSAICGASLESATFILGRSIQGVGSAGIFSGSAVSIVYTVPRHRRPLWQGLFGAIFGLSSMLGPVIGGVLTTKVSWRWCFYINLPIVAVSIVVIALLLHVPKRSVENLPVLDRLAQLDALGTLFLIPGLLCAVLALQWGGITFEWDSTCIIALFVLSGLLLSAFAVVQILVPETATIPLRIVKQRPIYSGLWAAACVGSQQNLFAYFLPIWLQGIQGLSAMDSGIRILPMTFAMVVASVLTGLAMSYMGYQTPFVLFGVCVLAVGAGLLTMLQVDTPLGAWVGYLAVYGLGLGCISQALHLAAQTALPDEDNPLSTSLLLFSQLFGGTIFTSVGQSVLDSDLPRRLTHVMHSLGTETVASHGVTSIRHAIPHSLAQGEFLSAYNESLRRVFLVGLILSCLTVFGALGMNARSINSTIQGPVLSEKVYRPDPSKTTTNALEKESSNTTTTTTTNTTTEIQYPHSLRSVKDYVQEKRKSVLYRASRTESILLGHESAVARLPPVVPVGPVIFAQNQHHQRHQRENGGAKDQLPSRAEMYFREGSFM